MGFFFGCTGRTEGLPLDFTLTCLMGEFLGVMELSILVLNCFIAVTSDFVAESFVAGSLDKPSWIFPYLEMAVTLGAPLGDDLVLVTLSNRSINNNFAIFPLFFGVLVGIFTGRIKGFLFLESRMGQGNLCSLLKPVAASLILVICFS